MHLSFKQLQICYCLPSSGKKYFPYNYYRSYWWMLASISMCNELTNDTQSSINKHFIMSNTGWHFLQCKTTIHDHIDLFVECLTIDSLFNISLQVVQKLRPNNEDLSKITLIKIDDRNVFLILGLFFFHECKTYALKNLRLVVPTGRSSADA